MEIKNINTVECPVKDLLYLIQQDDVEKLRSALLEVIDNFQPDGELYLYEQGYSVYQSKNKDFSPSLLEYRGDNESCLKKSQLMQSSTDSSSIHFDGFNYLPTDNYVQVFTVESERSNRGLLITINKNIINEHYIETLLLAYNRQVHLLRNKDTDSLTGLYNRQSFDTKLANLYGNIGLEKRSGDKQCECYLALLDIDFFKKINDTYGHVYGDEVLLLFSNMIKKTFRDIDLLFRYGGEEFAVLLKSVTENQTNAILNRFRENIETIPFPLENKVTVSIGYCKFTNDAHLPAIIERADIALYYSKEHGRNKVSSYELLREQNKIAERIIGDSDIELF
jgi:diguanylate cyclase (GGDEF)-like protein